MDRLTKAAELIYRRIVSIWRVLAYLEFHNVVTYRRDPFATLSVETAASRTHPAPIPPLMSSSQVCHRE
ncbi:hypothetical protein CHARACLAT_004497 [Characodon lateralis]|uniref:Uncharacterized protein n=1 Tax=Characodon lateralis TaxID=208331 RepID=A0ABU7DXU4_9TELE|nr:hypothetical protein [Characodon lateralis]